MAISDKQSENVLNLIYDAAAEEELWSAVLTEIADLTRSQGGVLFGQSMSAGRVYFSHHGRYEPQNSRVYHERHMQNVWSRHMEHQPVGRVVFSDDVIELSALRATAFFNEVLRPQEIAHNGMIALSAQEGFRAAFNIGRNARQGPFEADQQKLFEWLVPHLRRSITLGFRLDSYRAMRRAAFDVLEQLSDGVMLLDRRAHLMFANAAARALETSGVLRLRQSIATYSPSHSERLAELIRSALKGSPGGSMSMPGRIAGRPLTILVSSVRGKDVGRFSDLNIKDAAVLVFIIDPANRNSIPLARIMEAYDLTHAEARVALTSSLGKTVPETAKLLGLSPNTIKTHLRRVFAKTATARQAELARVLAAMGVIRFTNDGN